MLNITNHQENQNKTTIRCHCRLTKMSKFRTDTTKCWGGCGATGMPCIAARNATGAATLGHSLVASPANSYQTIWCSLWVSTSITQEKWDVFNKGSHTQSQQTTGNIPKPTAGINTLASTSGSTFSRKQHWTLTHTAPGAPPCAYDKWKEARPVACTL